MKLHLISDIHTDHIRASGPFNFLRSIKPLGVDAVVVAGDLSVVKGNQLNQALSILLNLYGRVFYVPGNHEYYGLNARVVDVVISNICISLGPNLHLLTPSSNPVDFMGHRFLGGTMWFPILPANWMHKGLINDFTAIKALEPWCYEHNSAFTENIKTNLLPGDVVVSHHLPSYKSVSLEYEGDPGNVFFVSEMDGIILDKKPALWLHGHTHSMADYVLGDTRVVCNPKGYPRENVGPYTPKEITI